MCNCWFKKKLNMNLPSRDCCVYTSCYCEENVWHLCKNIIENNELTGDCFCVFMSNNERAVQLWKQKICRGDGDKHFVMWDYHVFAIYGEKSNFYVLDLDTTLPFPVEFNEYAEKALRSEESIRFKRYFRVIPAKTFLETFSSDRRHMRVGDGWAQPPPNYPPIIVDKDDPHKLQKFIDMNAENGLGEVLNCHQFVSKFKK